MLFNFIFYKSKILAYSLGLIPSFQGGDQLLRKYTDRGEKGWEATSKIIKEIKQYFDDNKNAKLFFVLLPQDFQVDPEKREKYKSDKGHQEEVKLFLK